MKERNLIEAIRRSHKVQSKYLIKGIGDDCAVFSDSDDLCWLVSSDMLCEDIHFSLKWHSAYLLGRKSIAVNLSDIAAMGGTPRFVLISISIPKYIDDTWLEQWHKGVHSILEEFDCLLIGGDTTSGTTLTINVTVLGAASPDKVVYRSNACVGDDIYVSGNLGSSAAGLELLKVGVKKNPSYEKILEAHLNPRPQVSVGKYLGTSGLISSMQDISDGLATDLGHICKESGVGALIIQEELPYLEVLIQAVKHSSKNILDFLIAGGEDYQLVFTAPQKNRKKIKDILRAENCNPQRIGSIRDKKGVYLLTLGGCTEDITFAGFEHQS